MLEIVVPPGLGKDHMHYEWLKRVSGLCFAM